MKINTSWASAYEALAFAKRKARKPDINVSLLTAGFFLKLVQYQPQPNRKIQPFVVEEVRFTQT